MGPNRETVCETEITHSAPQSQFIFCWYYGVQFISEIYLPDKIPASVRLMLLIVFAFSFQAIQFPFKPIRGTFNVPITVYPSDHRHLFLYIESSTLFRYRFRWFCCIHISKSAMLIMKQQAGRGVECEPVRAIIQACIFLWNAACDLYVSKVAFTKCMTELISYISSWKHADQVPCRSYVTGNSIANHFNRKFQTKVQWHES